MARRFGGATAGIWAAIRGGWTRRELKYLLQGLPAVAAGTTAAVFVVVAGVQSRTLDDRYRTAADAAFAENPEAAGLYYRRLAGLDGGAPRTRFRLAMAYERKGDRSRAAELITGLLGGPDAAGYADAHRWVAHDILSSPGGRVGPGEAVGGVSAPAASPQGRPRRSAGRSASGPVPLWRWATRPVPSRCSNRRPRAARISSLISPACTRDWVTSKRRRRRTLPREKHYRQRVRTNPVDTDARARWAGTLVNLGRFEGSGGGAL